MATSACATTCSDPGSRPSRRALLLVAGLCGCGSAGPVGGKHVIPGPGDTGEAFFDPLEVMWVDDNGVVPEGEPIRVELLVRGGGPGLAEVTWTSDVDGPVAEDSRRGDGTVELAIDSLSPGWHQLSAEVVRGGTQVVEGQVGVCVWDAVLEPFATGLPAGWTVFGDASWDPGGWLEITGNAQSRQGAIFRTDAKVNPGDVAIEFDIATGGGINTGADGYAVSIIAAADATELASTIAAAQRGGCLGYGYGGACGTVEVSAVHIEFDTWHNTEFLDPTPENHIAITFDGDPSTHVFWTAVPTLEDLAWRHVRVEFRGDRIQVWLDGGQVIDGRVPGYAFEGGYIGASGSTGWASNYHRFDNLQLFDQCVIP